MCDCFYLPLDGTTYFGKNSDRNPDEPQALRLIQKRQAKPATSFGNRSYEVPDLGLAMALSCPTWMPGAEMGVNSAGVAIGNEAVFSRFKADPNGPLGMDYVRAALTGADSAEKALAIIIELTEKHGQGGIGSYKGKLVYNNSYMIVGRDGAYILETAQRRWAWKKITPIAAAISNSYTITNDFKRLDKETRKAIAPVNEQMACLDESDAGRLGKKESFKAYVEDRFMSLFSAGDARRRALKAMLPAAAELGTKKAVMAILRAHNAPDPEKPSRPRNICNHDKDIMGNPSTASMLVEYKDSRTMLWFTGASYACVNLFKPVLLLEDEFIPLWQDYDYNDGSDHAEYWQARRLASKNVWKKAENAEKHLDAVLSAQTEIFNICDSLPDKPNKDTIKKAQSEIGAIVKSRDEAAI